MVWNVCAMRNWRNIHDISLTCFTFVPILIQVFILCAYNVRNDIELQALCEEDKNVDCSVKNRKKIKLY